MNRSAEHRPGSLLVWPANSPGRCPMLHTLTRATTKAGQASRLPPTSGQSPDATVRRTVPSCATAGQSGNYELYFDGLNWSSRRPPKNRGPLFLEFVQKAIILFVVVMGVCCVSSAPAALETMADWANGDAPTTGFGVGGAAPAGAYAFSFATDATGSIAFTVTLNSGYTASNVSLVLDFTIAGSPNHGHQVAVGGNTYSSTGSHSLTLTATFDAEANSYTSIISYNTGKKGALSFTDVAFSGNVVPEFSGNAVPEPINVALAGFGVVFVGGTAGRWHLRREAGPRSPAA